VLQIGDKLVGKCVIAATAAAGGLIASCSPILAMECWDVREKMPIAHWAKLAPVLSFQHKSHV